MVGRWIPTDRELLLKWVRNTFEKVKQERAKDYQKLKEFFPDAETEEEILREFVKNASRIKEIGKVIPLHSSILALIKAMGQEPDVGMVIVQMFIQQDGKGLNTRDSIFFMDYLITFSPRFISEDLGKYAEISKQVFLIASLCRCEFTLHRLQPKTLKWFFW